MVDNFKTIINGFMMSSGVIGDSFNGGFTDASRGGIYNPHKRSFVVGIGEDFEVCQDVLDFFSTVEFDAANNLVRDFGTDEGFFEAAAHRVDAIKNGDIAELASLRAETVDLFCDCECFRGLIVGDAEAD